MKIMTIEKKDALYRVFKFLAKAIGKGVIRQFVTAMLVERNDKVIEFVCTDGRRLHRLTAEVDNPKLAVFDDGYYTVKAAAKEILFEKLDDTQCGFPDWKTVIPAYTKEDYIGSISGANYSRRDSDKGLHDALFPLYHAGLKINADYIKDIKEFEWSIYAFGHLKAVVFNADHFGNALQAVIMPIPTYDDDLKMKERFEKILEKETQKTDAAHIEMHEKFEKAQAETETPASESDAVEEFMNAELEKWGEDQEAASAAQAETETAHTETETQFVSGDDGNVFDGDIFISKNYMDVYRVHKGHQYVGGRYLDLDKAKFAANELCCKDGLDYFVDINTGEVIPVKKQVINPDAPDPVIEKASGYFIKKHPKKFVYTVYYKRGEVVIKHAIVGEVIQAQMQARLCCQENGMPSYSYNGLVTLINAKELVVKKETVYADKPLALATPKMKFVDQVKSFWTEIEEEIGTLYVGKKGRTWILSDEEFDGAVAFDSYTCNIRHDSVTAAVRSIKWFYTIKNKTELPHTTVYYVFEFGRERSTNKKIFKIEKNEVLTQNLGLINFGTEAFYTEEEAQAEFDRRTAAENAEKEFFYAKSIFYDNGKMVQFTGSRICEKKPENEFRKIDGRFPHDKYIDWF